MSWPLSQDYNEAIQTLAVSFSDPDLRQAEVVTNALWLPQPCSGNFADVYQVRTPEQRWAVKCFTREIPGLQERYREISAYLKQARLPFMVEFQFLEEAYNFKVDCCSFLLGGMGGVESRLAGDGRLVVGLHGRSGNELIALGLVQKDPGD